MEMSKVCRCDVAECAYNDSRLCHALAITVGDASHPRCDTIFICEESAVDLGSTAGVGACKTIACGFNKGLECSQSEISVGYCQNEVDCLTFRPR